MDAQQTFVPRTEFNWLKKVLIYIGGGDPETLARCPTVERDHILLLALIPICVFLYQAGIYGLTAHYLFAAPDSFRPDLVLIGLFLAAFFLVQDIYCFNRALSYTAGAIELGLPASPSSIAKTALFAAIRLAEAIGISQLCAIFFALILFTPDIGASIKNEWLRANATLIAVASQPVDAGIRRQTDLVNKQADVVTQLSGQVSQLQAKQVDPSAGDPQMEQAQAELKALLDQKAAADQAVIAAQQFASNELAGIRGSPQNSGKPGKGPRRAAALEQLRDVQDRAKSLETSIAAARARIDALRKQLDANGTATKLEAHDELPVYEQSLAEARDKLNALETHLRELVGGRDAAIESAVEKAPDYVPYDNGLLHRVVVLEQIVNSDPKIFWMVVLIDLVALSFELAGVFAKLTVYIPSSYNALLVHDTYRRIDDIADRMRKRNGDPDADTTNLSHPPGPNGPFGTGGLFAPASNPRPANDNRPNRDAATGTDGLGAAQPPKRRRGRPPKNKVITDANGSQGNSGTSPEPQK